jgi:aminocarboxymuconate-semialdehyde decarboxylase
MATSGTTHEVTDDRPVLDVHAHLMPLPLLRWLAARGLGAVSLERDLVRLDPRVCGVGPGTPLPLLPSQYRVEVRLQELDRLGLSHQAVSMPPFLFCSTATDPRFVREIVRRGNDELAALVALENRLPALGSAPVGWPFAADEARRCLDELGMAGIAIASRGAGRDLDDPVNDELWALLAERSAFVFLHPSGIPDPLRQQDFWLPELVGYPLETALAASRMIFGGVLERFGLRLGLAHGGGGLPSLRGRLDLGWARGRVAHTTVAAPSELLGRLYYDTAVFSDRLLRRLIEDVGADHVLLGTDHPFELADRTPIETVGGLGLPEAGRRAVLWDNAAELLGLTEPKSIPKPAR